MNQKSNNTSTIIRKDLQDVLKDYPTKTDLKTELSNYPTKADLKTEIKESEERIDQKFTKRLLDSQNAFRAESNQEHQLMREDILAGMAKFTNLILTTFDPLLKEIETRREDREIAVAEMRDIKKRLTKLEHS